MTAAPGPQWSGHDGNNVYNDRYPFFLESLTWQRQSKR